MPLRSGLKIAWCVLIDSATSPVTSKLVLITVAPVPITFASDPVTTAPVPVTPSHVPFIFAPAPPTYDPPVAITFDSVPVTSFPVTFSPVPVNSVPIVLLFPLLKLHVLLLLFACPLLLLQFPISQASDFTSLKSTFSASLAVVCFRN